MLKNLKLNSFKLSKIKSIQLAFLKYEGNKYMNNQKNKEGETITIYRSYKKRGTGADEAKVGPGGYSR